MAKITALFKNAYVRLAGRALVAAAGVVAAKYLSGNHEVQALIVAGVLAFAEVFTPLNGVVGILRQPSGSVR